EESEVRSGAIAPNTGDFSPNDQTIAEPRPNLDEPPEETEEVAEGSETATSAETEEEPAGEETIQDLPLAEGAFTGLGRRLGDFVLEKKIGQGGMGEVYRARQISLDRVVAIKILPKALAAQPDFIERFQREAKSAANLVHPN